MKKRTATKIVKCYLHYISLMQKANAGMCLSRKDLKFDMPYSNYQVHKGCACYLQHNPINKKKAKS